MSAPAFEHPPEASSVIVGDVALDEAFASDGGIADTCAQVPFRTFTGTVVFQESRSVTVADAIGSASSRPVRSTAIERVAVWLRRSDGKEAAFVVPSSSAHFGEGQTVTVSEFDLDGRRLPGIVYNHDLDAVRAGFDVPFAFRDRIVFAGGIAANLVAVVLLYVALAGYGARPLLVALPLLLGNIVFVLMDGHRERIAAKRAAVVDFLKANRLAAREGSAFTPG